MFVFFFFSSRRRHTRLQGDWSSDVCSSDLWQPPPPRAPACGLGLPGCRLSGSLPTEPDARTGTAAGDCDQGGPVDRSDRRSEERRVGKSVDLGGRRIIKKKKRKK